MCVICTRVSVFVYKIVFDCNKNNLKIILKNTNRNGPLEIK